MHNVIDIDEEKEKYEECVADINTLIENGNQLLNETVGDVAVHYAKELQRLEDVGQNILYLVNSFMKKRKREIAKNQKESMKSIQAAKAVLEDAKNQVTASGKGGSKNCERINAHQAENILHSLAVKLQEIQRAGIPRTTHNYGQCEIHEWQKPRELTFSDLSHMTFPHGRPNGFMVPLLGTTGLKALDIGE